MRLPAKMARILPAFAGDRPAFTSEETVMALRKFWRGAHLAILGLLLLLGTAVGRNEEAIEARMRRDITFLASDECEGRRTETEGIQNAANYIGAEFARAGPEPGR